MPSPVTQRKTAKADVRGRKSLGQTERSAKPASSGQKPKSKPGREARLGKLPAGQTHTVLRRQEQKEKTRERIVNAATKVLLREGVDGFSMRKLAEQVGYTPTAIYFHFPDREALLSEVVERQFLKFRQSFEIIAKTQDPIARLRVMGLALIQFAVEHPAHYRCLFLVPLNHIPKGRLIEKGNPSQDCYALLHSTIAEALADGRFRPEHKCSQTLAQVFFAGVHGVAALHLIKGEDDWIQWTDLRERSRTMVDGLIAGICCTPKVASQTVAPRSPRSTGRSKSSTRSRQ